MVNVKDHIRVMIGDKSEHFGKKRQDLFFLVKLLFYLTGLDTIRNEIGNSLTNKIKKVKNTLNKISA